jgi:hypothetical protein
VHRDAPSHAHEKWQEDLRYFRSLKDVYFFGMGDYLDSTSTTERECLGSISTKMHETFRDDIQALQLAKVEMIAKEIAFMKGRIIGMINGNHFFQFQSGINSDQKLCELLGATYFGVCSFVRLTFESFGRRVTRDIFAHHGQGAARLVGGSINRVAQMFEGVECDIAAMGHDHKRAAVPGTPRLFLSKGKTGELQLRTRQTMVIRSGSYLKSYEPGKVNYNVDSQRSTCDLGHVEMIITLRDDKKSEPQIEMKALV